MYSNPWKDAGARPMMQHSGAVGRTFYVNSNVGNNDNTGQDPSDPLDTITYALTLCDTGANDYIFVYRVDQTAETWPIAVTISYVHIIGTPSQATPTPMIRPDENAHGFTISGGGGVEIAGFNHCTNDEGWNKAAIYIDGNSWMNHIHHNNFAWDAPLYDGIYLESAQQTLIQYNYFGAHGFDRYGVFIDSDSGRNVVRDNYFVQNGNVLQGTYAVNCASANQCLIANNMFLTEGSGAGEAVHCTGATNAVIGNRAANGQGATGGAIPYEDASNANHWGDNMDNTTYSAIV